MTYGRIHRGPRRGFTLIESMATVTVLGALAGVASLIIFNAVDGFTEAATAAQLHVEASIALDRAVREIRKIELDDSEPGIAPYITGIDSNYLLWRDSEDDAYVLVLAAGNITLQVDGGPASVLLTDVTGLTIKAFDESNDEIALPLGPGACDDVRRISIEITLQRNGVTHSLRSKVFIRSTMSGGAP